MKVFIYYNKLDPSKEPYGKFEAIDLAPSAPIILLLK